MYGIAGVDGGGVERLWHFLQSVVVYLLIMRWIVVFFFFAGIDPLFCQRSDHPFAFTGRVTEDETFKAVIN